MILVLWFIHEILYPDLLDIKMKELKRPLQFLQGMVFHFLFLHYVHTQWRLFYDMNRDIENNLGFFFI